MNPNYKMKNKCHNMKKCPLYESRGKKELSAYT